MLCWHHTQTIRVNHHQLSSKGIQKPSRIWYAICKDTRYRCEMRSIDNVSYQMHSSTCLEGFAISSTWWQLSSFIQKSCYTSRTFVPLNSSLNKTKSGICMIRNCFTPSFSWTMSMLVTIAQTRLYWKTAIFNPSGIHNGQYPKRFVSTKTAPSSYKRTRAKLIYN